MVRTGFLFMVLFLLQKGPSLRAYCVDWGLWSQTACVQTPALLLLSRETSVSLSFPTCAQGSCGGLVRMPCINLCAALSTEPASSPENAGCCCEDTCLGGSPLILGELAGQVHGNREAGPWPRRFARVSGRFSNEIFSWGYSDWRRWEGTHRPPPLELSRLPGDTVRQRPADCISPRIPPGPGSSETSSQSQIPATQLQRAQQAQVLPSSTFLPSKEHSRRPVLGGLPPSKARRRGGF